MSTKDEKIGYGRYWRARSSRGCRVGEDMEGGGFYRGEACAERRLGCGKRRAGGGPREDVAVVKQYRGEGKNQACVCMALGGCRDVAFVIGRNLWISSREKKDVLVAGVVPEIEAGTSRAVLLMEQGERIDLSLLAGDTILNKGDVRIRLDSSKSVTYERVAGTPAKIEYNTIIVPRKGEYQLILADGSKVYLNSESRLRFPTRFEGKERRVYLEGEGYFEVAKDTAKPFIVEAKEVDVRVLGTSFNVSAYVAEQAIRTTLVSGKVRVGDRLTGKGEVILAGQQAEWKDGTFTTKEVDTSIYTAWIDGKFYFEGATLEEITAQLERWYDIDFFFTSEKVRRFAFAGVINKEYSANKIFSIIEKTTRVRFNVNGRVVTVSEVNNKQE
ncbi:MAG: FecR family protein [Butyricimonas paravirosa]